MSGQQLTARRASFGASWSERTRAMLLCGVVAGALFVAVSGLQAATREGFDLERHPISALTLGEGGWVQTATFVVSGLLTLIFSAGTRRVLRGGRGGTWVPILMGAFGLGLVLAGVFVPDPANGFPPGAPDGMPDRLSVHAVVHGIGFAIAFTAVTAAAVVVAIRSAARGERRWALYTVGSAIAAFVLSAWPGTSGASIRYAAASLVVWAWVAALAGRLIRGRPMAPDDARP
jgi:hypothetical membrane protein